VRIRLRPVDSTFHDLFVESAGHLGVGASLLAEMLAVDADKAGVFTRMQDAEHAADLTNHEIARRASTSFVTPLDRDDIYRLSSALDEVLDEMEAAVEQMYLYDVRLWPTGIGEQINLLQRCAELTVEAMPRVTARGVAEQWWIEINRLENAGDHNHRRLLAELYSGQYPALEVMKLKDIAESLEGALNAFEDVAGVVEQITVKSS
jgi:uncharacterized protein